jgi:5-formyltetrahydrofolate cyclo-ligase
MMRRKRAALPRTERTRAAAAVAAQAARSFLLRPARRTAVYLAMGGELDTHPIIDRCRRMRCSLFLPRIAHIGRTRMQFVPFVARSPLRVHRLGMREPRPSGFGSRSIDLDIVFVPLVAFDIAGNRLGMGAGFYDRCFARLRLRTRWRRPKLIGLAYEFQLVAGIEAQPWDVRLDAVVTEKGIYWMGRDR